MVRIGANRTCGNLGVTNIIYICKVNLSCSHSLSVLMKKKVNQDIILDSTETIDFSSNPSSLNYEPFQMAMT